MVYLSNRMTVHLPLYAVNEGKRYTVFDQDLKLVKVFERDTPTASFQAARKFMNKWNPRMYVEIKL